jgi:DNA (cytosine-5)-methyltransferase 1
LVETLLPTPLAGDGVKGSPRQKGSKGDLSLPSAIAQLNSRADTEAHRHKSA